MAIDYEKLLNLDYTAHDHFQDFRSRLNQRGLSPHSIHVEKRYGEDNTPEVVVKASDHTVETEYVYTYTLENVGREEFEEIMFDTWAMAMKELEH